MSIDTSTTRPRRPGKTSVAAQRFFTGLHASLYRLSGGAVGGKMGKSPVLLLNTTGRKSGKIRTTPLLYLADGDRFVLVASNGGTEKHPLWWLNLQAHPQAQIEVGRRKLAVTAV